MSEIVTHHYRQTYREVGGAIHLGDIEEHVMTRLTLTAPLIIGSRLLPAVRVGDDETGGTISLDLADGRVYIDPFRDFSEVVTEAPTLGAWYDGAGRESQAVREIMATTLDFLGAFAEAHNPSRGGPDHEQWDLFPVELGEWAYLNSDEITMAAEELKAVFDYDQAESRVRVALADDGVVGL